MEKMSGKRVAELTKALHRASSVEEVIERGKPLGMDFSNEEAQEYLELITPLTGIFSDLQAEKTLPTTTI